MHQFIFRTNCAVDILARSIHKHIFKTQNFNFLVKNNICSAVVTQKETNMSGFSTAGVALEEVVSQLKSFASTSLAESWDNVGLLIEPYTARKIEKILLTNDLTEAVMQEALQKNVQMIISYHPPIFAPLKSITKRTWKERLVAACLENRIALYSPHTSFDAVKGGVNDWLASAFETETVTPLKPSNLVGSSVYLADVTFQKPNSDESLKDISDKGLPGGDDNRQTENIEVQNCGENRLLLKMSSSMVPNVMNVFKIADNTKVSVPECGVGRFCSLKTAQPLKRIVGIVKAHVKVPDLRLALAVGKTEDSQVSSIAICAGSGASVLKGVKADLYLTGEMSHHEVLDAVHCGSHVILCEHSNSERGFLSSFAHNLQDKLLSGRVQVLVSVADRDPLQVV